MSARTLSLSFPGAASCHYEGPYKPLEASKRPVSMLHEPWLVDEYSKEYLFHQLDSFKPHQKAKIYYRVMIQQVQKSHSMVSTPQERIAPKGDEKVGRRSSVKPVVRSKTAA